MEIFVDLVFMTVCDLALLMLIISAILLIDFTMAQLRH